MAGGEGCGDAVCAVRSGSPPAERLGDRGPSLLTYQGVSADGVMWVGIAPLAGIA